MTTATSTGSVAKSTPNPLSVGSVAAPPANPDDAGSSDRFLKLLVAQMQNQDPLNPMDNAQVTTQMAQISTVDGIGKLNTTVAGLNSQFVQMQALQGAALVGHDVVIKGDKLMADDDGTLHGTYQLDAAAGSVTVEVLSAAGRVIDTVDEKAQKGGRHDFDWKPSEGVDATLGKTFRIVAKTSAATSAATIGSTALMRDTVDAVSTAGDKLTLELQRLGNIAYGDIQAFL